MYQGFIEKIYGDIESQIIKRDEENIVYAVNQAVGYCVDKDELIKALKYDRHQYNKGYFDGVNNALSDAAELIDFLYSMPENEIEECFGIDYQEQTWTSQSIVDTFGIKDCIDKMKWYKTREQE